jgi:hypothetical protein
MPENNIARVMRKAISFADRGRSNVVVHASPTVSTGQHFSDQEAAVT